MEIVNYKHYVYSFIFIWVVAWLSAGYINGSMLDISSVIKTSQIFISIVLTFVSWMIIAILNDR